MPHVSWRPSLFSRKLLREWNPKVVVKPPTMPMAMATAGWYRNPDEAPITTPPAKVALSMSSISNFLPMKEVRMKVARQLPVREQRVLATIWFCSQKDCASTPKLKEGQQIQRKRVPTIASTFDHRPDVGLYPGLALLLRIQLTPSPKQAPKMWITVVPPASNIWIFQQFITSLNEQPMVCSTAATSISLGPTLPMNAPKAMRTEAAQYEDLVMVCCWMGMQQLVLAKPTMTFVQKSLKSTQSCMAMALARKVQMREEREQVLMKVQSSPKPTRIITFTSWKAMYLSLRKVSPAKFVSMRTKTPKNNRITASNMKRRTLKVRRGELTTCCMLNKIISTIKLVSFNISPHQLQQIDILQPSPFLYQQEYHQSIHIVQSSPSPNYVQQC